MGKKRLMYRCLSCKNEYPFEKKDLPSEFIYPEDFDRDENKITLLAIDCPTPDCGATGCFTPEEIKKVLNEPVQQETKWKFFWEE